MGRRVDRGVCVCDDVGAFGFFWLSSLLVLLCITKLMFVALLCITDISLFFLFFCISVNDKRRQETKGGGAYLIRAEGIVGKLEGLYSLIKVLVRSGLSVLCMFWFVMSGLLLSKFLLVPFLYVWICCFCTGVGVESDGGCLAMCVRARDKI